jgi:non-reducing end alpha-L-arabinofuranosidase
MRFLKCCSCIAVVVVHSALMGCGSGGSDKSTAIDGSASMGGAVASGAGSGGSASGSGPAGSGGTQGLAGTSSGGGGGAAGGMLASAGQAGATTVAGAGGAAGSGGGAAGTGGAGGSSGAGLMGPCDLYQSGNTPCVAAHSMVRALYGSYSGKLYQVRRASDKTTKDIPVLSPGGFVDASVHDAFCAGTTCTISYIYDQSPLNNDLPLSPPVHWLPNGGKEADAAPGKAKVGGHTVYGVYVQSDVGNTYRNNKAKNIPTGDEPESIYMVADGKHFNGRCCFDYGNVETTGNDDGRGTMETLEWGNILNWSHGSGNGPWVMVDLEDGVFAGDQATGSVSVNTPLSGNYATLMFKGPSGNHMTLKGGDAQSGLLAVKYDGARPSGYSPMKKEGAVELGTGGDGSAGGVGTFFEGALIAGVPSDAVDAAVQANIVAAGYGR